MAIQGFNKEFYLNAKLAQLQSNSETAADWAGKDAAFLEARFSAVGLTAEEHYEQFGYKEDLAPNAFFNPAEYIRAKAVDLFNDPSSSYLSVDAAAAAFQAAWTGNVYDHYLQFGEAEGVNPSNAFDVSGYYEAKLAQLQAAGNTEITTTAQVKAAFDAAGLTALEHFVAFGQNEGITAPAVPAGEQVNVDTSVPGETFSLTTGADNFTGTANDDTFAGSDVAAPGATPTWSAGDKIDGGLGNDTFNVVQANPISVPTGATVTNVENVNLQSGSSINVDTTSSFSGLTALKTTTSNATQDVTAAATTDVTAIASARSADAVTINGGKDVSVTATGTVAGGNISIGNTTAAKGAVTVSETIAGAGNVAAGAISVKGGTTVNTTTTATNSNLNGTTVTQGDVTVTGTADTTAATVKQSAAVTAVTAVPAVANNVTESAVVTWQPFAADGTQSIGGMTITNTSGGAVTADDVATVAGGGTVLGVAITTAPGGWNVSTATGATNTFTSTTPNANVTDVDNSTGSSGAGNSAPTAVVTQGSAAAAAVTGVGGIAAGDVSITDVNAASTTAAGKITTVSLENFDAATVNSGALTTLNLAGKGASVDAGTLGALTTAANTSLAVNTNGLTTTGAVTIDSDITTVNVTSSTAKSTVASLIAGGAKSINVSGDAVLAVNANTLGALTDVTVTNTAGFQLGGTAINTAATFTGGAGDDAVSLDATTKAITMGAGNDTVTSAGLVGTGGSVDAGDGNDTIVMTSAQAADADDNATFNSKFTGFETLQLSNQLATGTTLNLTGINGVSTVALTAGGATGTSVIGNLVNNGTVKLTADSTEFAVQVKDATFNAADVLNLELSKAGVLAAGTITAAGVETVNITSADAVATGSAAAINTMTLTAADATTITVAGNNGIDLSSSVAAKVTSFDASGVVGNGTADTAANLAVTYASDNNTATASVSITGGAGNDVLTGGDAKDTIVGGAGDDVITGGKGIDTLTGGAGRDTFKFAAGDAGITGAEKITDFTLGLTGDTIDLAATGITANQTATNVTAQISGAVDVTATVKDGILTIGGADAALVDSLGEFKSVFEAIDTANAADSAAFVFGGNTYVISDDATNAVQDIIQLTGITNATSLATTAAEGAILIG